MRVLLIEDSIRLCESLRLGLEKLGFAVDMVHDGKRGLSYAANNPYDVVVLDVMLPEMDGIEVLRELRRRGCDTHVLMLTARDRPEDRVQGLDAGADDYLPKPFDFDELVARLRALLRRRYGKNADRDLHKTEQCRPSKIEVKPKGLIDRQFDRGGARASTEGERDGEAGRANQEDHQKDPRQHPPQHRCFDVSPDGPVIEPQRSRESEVFSG